VLIIVAVVGLALRPDLAAQGADLLRAVAGDAVVAWLENSVFTLRDQAQQEAYLLGLIRADAPWAATAPPPARPPLPRATPAPALAAPTTPAPDRPADRQAQQAALPTAALAPAAEWQPAPLSDVGTMDGAGQWSPYLTDADGRVFAYRTFVQPDPDRP
jgi:hypothetical protein